MSTYFRDGFAIPAKRSRPGRLLLNLEKLEATLLLVKGGLSPNKATRQTGFNRLTIYWEIQARDHASALSVRLGTDSVMTPYQVRSDMKKFVPVLFEPQDEPFIPRPLLGHTHYLLSSEENYNKLCAFLVGGAGVSPGELGSLRELAREKVNPLRFGEPRIKKGSLSNLTSEAVFIMPLFPLKLKKL